MQTIERGSPASVFSNLAIALLSTAVSLTASLLTTTVDNDRVYMTLVTVTVVSYVAGIAFVLLSKQQGDPVKKTLKAIRSRVPPEGEQAGT